MLFGVTLLTFSLIRIVFLQVFRSFVHRLSRVLHLLLTRLLLLLLLTRLVSPLLLGLGRLFHFGCNVHRLVFGPALFVSHLFESFWW